MKLTEFIHGPSIIATLQSTERDGVIGELVQSLVASGSIDQSSVEEVTAAIVKREKNGSTGFGKGVAVPHVKHPKVKKLAGTVGLSSAGVDFAALDHKPVHTVFMLLSPVGADQQHLAAMEVVFRSLNKDLFRKFLKQSTTREQVEDLLRDTDAGK
jgi:nitrogen PTS system EIIA component